MSEEWGPWIEHDGKGCPCVGEFVHLVAYGGQEDLGVPTSGLSVPPPPGFWNTWFWDSIPPWKSAARVIRYRIRKPRGLTILEGLLENLPEEVDA